MSRRSWEERDKCFAAASAGKHRQRRPGRWWSEARSANGFSPRPQAGVDDRAHRPLRDSPTQRVASRGRWARESLRRGGERARLDDASEVGRGASIPTNRRRTAGLRGAWCGGTRGEGAWPEEKEARSCGGVEGEEGALAAADGSRDVRRVSFSRRRPRCGLLPPTGCRITAIFGCFSGGMGTRTYQAPCVYVHADQGWFGRKIGRQLGARGDVWMSPWPPTLAQPPLSHAENATRGEAGQMAGTYCVPHDPPPGVSQWPNSVHQPRGCRRRAGSGPGLANGFLGEDLKLNCQPALYGMV